MVTPPGNSMYIVTIQPAFEGFIVSVEERILPLPSSDLDSFKDQVSDMVQMAQNPPTEIDMLIRDANRKGKNEPKFQILGPHIFNSFERMNAFLEIVYSEDIRRYKIANSNG